MNDDERQEILEAFAKEICDRNAKLGLTPTSRHFGRIDAKLARNFITNKETE